MTFYSTLSGPSLRDGNVALHSTHAAVGDLRKRRHGALPLPARRYALFTCMTSAAGSLEVAVVLSNLLL